MRISEQFATIGAALPKAARALQDLNGIALYHESYGGRHPFAAYKLSLAHVASRLRTTLEILAKTQQEMMFLDVKHSGWEQPLVDATDHLLDALMEHLEDCGGIIRSFYPSLDERSFKSVYAEYKRSVDPYRQHIGKIVNYIKHKQGRLRSVVFSWPGASSLGYFVEGPTSDGALGPVAVIHPTENTAFSYNRDIAFHVCSVFAVGARLAAALHMINRNIVASNSTKPVATRDTDLVAALKFAAALPLQYFEDEIGKDVPLVRLRNGGIQIEYPGNKVTPMRPPSGARISLSFRGDGVTRSFRMPYFKGRS